MDNIPFAWDPGRARRHVLLVGTSALLIVAGAIELSAARRAGPTYDSPVTRELVERMIAAHGGMEAWRSSEAVSYDHILKWPDPPEGSPEWLVHDETVDQSTRRAYQHWPLTSARLVDDGQDLWTVDWAGDTHPKLLVRTTYYFAFMPWLTQDDGVHLEAAGIGTLPDVEGELQQVRMSFEAGDDAFTLMIDAETGLLRGLFLELGDREILDLFGVPTDVMRVPGPLHSYLTYIDAGGLRVPAEFRTRGPDGSTIGYHVIHRIDLNARFDESRMERPATAEVVQ